MKEVASIPDRETYDEELDDPETENDTGISKGMRVSLTTHERDAQRSAQTSIVRRHYLPFLQAGSRVIVAGDPNDSRGPPALRKTRGCDDIYGTLPRLAHTRYFDDDELSSRWTYQFEGVRN